MIAVFVAGVFTGVLGLLALFVGLVWVYESMLDPNEPHPAKSGLR